MLFNSFGFLIFFPIVVGIYFSLPHRFRWCFLLLASYYFYMCWKVEYIFLIVASTLSVYLAALLMSQEKEQKKRKKFLYLSLGFNLMLLFVFKYSSFFNDSVRTTFNYFNIFYNVPSFKLLLPVGISFYTFQTIGYLMDVYREEVMPQKHLGIFAVYVAFFPQLVSGPIERAPSFLPQFFEKHSFDYQRVRDGLTLMLWGGFKKVVIADRLGVMVNEVYGNPTKYTGLPSIIATVFFAFQVYCDFSGYSDIAIGAGKVMGFRLMKNFDRPFASRSISEYWRRWHISLSSWIRDYLFMPLAIKKRAWMIWGTVYSSMISFVLIGLWHGAGWNFLVYGMLFGLAHSSEILTKKIRLKISTHIPPKIYSIICLLTTFAIVNFALIFFRARNLGDALYIVRHLISFEGTIPQFFIVHKNEFYIAIVGVLIMECVQLLMIQKNLWQRLCTSPRWLRWPAYYALIISIGVFGDLSHQEFIYFQF